MKVQAEVLFSDEQLGIIARKLATMIPAPEPDPPSDLPGIIIKPGDPLQEAINDAGSTPIYLREGTYAGGFIMRQGTQLLSHPDNTAPPLVTGAVPVKPETWTKSGDVYSIVWNRPFYQHPAHQVRAKDGKPVPAGLRHRAAMQPHMIVVDGEPLKTIYRTEDMAPGCMYLEGTAGSPKRIHVRFPDDRPPSNFDVQAAVHQRVIYCEHKDVDGVILKGLALRFCANTGYQGMIDLPEMADNWVLEDIDAQWSNSEGLRLMGTGHTIRNLITNNHGQNGISTEKMLRSTLEHIETSYNNWKGFDPKWDAGNKIRNSKENRIHFLKAIGNPIWLDIWNMGNIMQDFEIIDSTCWGLMVEHHSSDNEFIDGVIRGTRNFEGTSDNGSNLHIQGSCTGNHFTRLQLIDGDLAAVHMKKKENRGGNINYTGRNFFDEIRTEGNHKWIVEGSPDYMPDEYKNMGMPPFTVWSR